MSISFYTVPSRSANEHERERAVIRSGALNPAAPEKLSQITANARHRLRGKMALVSIIYQEHAHVIAATGFCKGLYRRSTSICGHAILEPHKLFVVPDASLDIRFGGIPCVDEPEGTRFYAAAALMVDGRLPIGTLCVLDTRARLGLSVDEADALLSLADATMNSLACGTS